MSLFNLGQKALFALDAETAHAATVRMLKTMPRLSAQLMRVGDPTLPTRCMGLEFRNPVGVAAGLDKNGECIDALAGMGFGFVEIGTVTPRPQPGNPRPRMFRLPEHQAVINRLGFNNRGVEYLCRQVERARRDCVLGINLGKNADTPMDKAVDDYLLGLERVYALADYVTINISSPNTKNLRELQEQGALRDLLERLLTTRDQLAVAHGRRVPMALKLAPDLEPAQIDSTAAALAESGIDAVIATNTTIRRDMIAGHPLAAQAGGLSGAPLCSLSQQVFEALRERLPPEIEMIGVGGIHDQTSARARLEAGARLIQVYTGFVYRGPALLADALRAARAVRASDAVH